MQPELNSICSTEKHAKLFKLSRANHCCNQGLIRGLRLNNLFYRNHKI